ncbi:MAG: hypothetical protein ACREA9_15990 [Pyrinomonadaceae bacterium]
MLRSNVSYRSVKIMTPRLVLAAAVLCCINSGARPTSAWPRAAYHGAAVSLQQEDGWAAIKLDEGVLLVWNAGELHFFLTIKGKEIKPVNDPDHLFFTVDGKALQIQVAAIKDFAPDAKEKKLDARAILAAHRDWESKYIEDLIHSKLTVRTFNAKLSNGSDALMWQFDMPEGMNAEAQKQLYLTLVTKDYVLMLNSEATATLPDADGRKFLLDTIATLKVSPTPIDFKQLSESIRTGTKP